MFFADNNSKYTKNQPIENCRLRAWSTNSQIWWISHWKRKDFWGGKIYIAYTNLHFLFVPYTVTISTNFLHSSDCVSIAALCNLSDVWVSLCNVIQYRALSFMMLDQLIIIEFAIWPWQKLIAQCAAGGAVILPFQVWKVSGFNPVNEKRWVNRIISFERKKHRNSQQCQGHYDQLQRHAEFYEIIKFVATRS